MADDGKAADRKVQPRFSQFALAAARDTSAFETPAAGPDRAFPGDAGEPPVTEASDADGIDVLRPDPAAATPASHKRERAAKASPPPAEPTAEELVSFTVRLPASLYMRMRRSLGLREKLGELCVAAITRELDLRR